MNISSDDIIIRKAVIQLLDVETGKFISAQELFDMDSRIMELVRKQLFYSMNSDELKSAKWNPEEPVFKSVTRMDEKNDTSFIQISAELAERLFDIMCDSAEIPSGDLLCVSYMIHGNIYYALIKLNFSLSFIHRLEKVDTKEIIQEICNQKTLALSKKPSEIIIFNLSKQDVMLREKKYEMLDGDKIFYLSERFLRCYADIDSKKKYQILCRTVNNINKNYPEDGLKKQMEIKSKLYNIFKEDQQFKINKIGQKLFGDNPQKKQDFDEKMERYELQYDSFAVEKEDTIKNLEYISLRTDKELQIKIPIEEYMTTGCIEIQEEPDGSKKIIIKNIEQVTVQ